MGYKYILAGHTPVECADVLAWGRWFETADRVVAKDERDTVLVSTVFLGMNQRFGDSGLKPIVFETMVFGGPYDGDQDHYCTWEQAEAGHVSMCAKVFQT